MMICLPSNKSLHSGEGTTLLLDTWTVKRLASFLIVVFALMPFYVIVTLTRDSFFGYDTIMRMVFN